jgi:hypothetical protein
VGSSVCLSIMALFLIVSAPPVQAQDDPLQGSHDGWDQNIATISLMTGVDPLLPTYTECIRQGDQTGGVYNPYLLQLESLELHPGKFESFGTSMSEVNVLLQFAGFGYHLIGAENINGWTEGSFDNVARAFAMTPQWDTDGIFMNYIGHPYMGSTLCHWVGSDLEVGCWACAEIVF